MPNAHNAGKKGVVPGTRDNASRNHRLSWIARIAVATAAILWVFRDQNWHELAAAFGRLSLGWFAFSLGVFIVAQVVIGLRWWLLLRAQSIYIPVFAAVKLFFLGLFYNNVMPGAVGGDLLKAWYVTKHTDRKIAGVLSVFIDRAIGLVALILMAVFTYAVFVGAWIAPGGDRGGAGSAHRFSQYGSLILWVVVISVGVLTVLLIHPRGRVWLRAVAAKAWAKGLVLLRETVQATVVYCSRPWTVLAAFGLTFFSQSTVILAFWLLGRNAGIEAGMRYYFVVFPVMWVVAAVPVSIGGLGVFEAGVVKMFGLLAGVPPEQAMVLALCQRFLWVLASLPGGLVHLLGAHLPRGDISVDCEEGGN